MADEPDQNRSSENKLPDVALSLAAARSKENVNAAGDNPDTDTHTESGQELGQSPDDFKTFCKYLAKKEDDRILKEEERACKEEERAEKLYNTLSKSVESSTEQANRLQKAVEAIKPKPSQEPKEMFWNAYKAVSEEHDNEFRAKHNDNLGTSLLFAGLFSAVSSAFIIQIQSNLIQNPDDVTQALLRLLIHSTNDSIFSGPDLIIPEWNGPPPSIVAVEGMLYTSFFATLLAALLAVLGKQWLAYYAGVGMRGTIRERGIERQKKFDGFRRWGFEYVMMILPVLLEMGLLLFGVAITVYLWSLQRTIAGIVLTISLAGIAAYVFFVLSDIFAMDSPFRTPLSAGLLKMGSWVKIGSLSVARLVNRTLLSCRNHLRFRKMSQVAGNISLEDLADENAVALESTVVQQPANKWGYPWREIPLLEPQTIIASGDEYDCLAVLWMLETSTDQDVVAAAGSMAVGLQWSLNINFIPPLIRLRDTFMGCFEGSPGLKLRESAIGHAIICGQAYHHLYVIHQSAQTLSQPEDYDVYFPEEFFGQIIGGDSRNGPFDSIELTFVYGRLRNKFPWARFSWFPPSFFRWALHISPYYCYFNPGPSSYLRLQTTTCIRLSSPGFVDRSSFTNSLLYLGSYLGVPLNSHDLAIVNKGGYCEKVLEEFLQYLVGCNQVDSFSRMVHEVLETITIYLENMDRPPDLSNNRYKEYIYQLCRALPDDSFRPTAAFTAIRLVSVFQKGRPVALNRTRASESLSNEPEKWISEVLEHICEHWTHLDAETEWDDRIAQDVEDHLRVLIQVPHFDRHGTSHQFLRILSNSISLESYEREPLRRLAYTVICLACNHWFDNEYLLPEIQRLNIFSRLGSVVDLHIMDVGRLYMHIVATLSKIHAWASVIRYDIHCWFYLYGRFYGQKHFEESFIPAFKYVAAVDDEEFQRVGTGNILALALMAMENVWRNFDFSSRIAIESFCRLADSTWNFLDPRVPWMSEANVKATGELLARIGRAIRYARNSLLESRAGMEQEEIGVVEGINKELMYIEVHQLKRYLTDDSEQMDLQVAHDYTPTFRCISSLDASLQLLLTRPRCYLGTVQKRYVNVCTIKTMIFSSQRKNIRAWDEQCCRCVSPGYTMSWISETGLTCLLTEGGWIFNSEAYGRQCNPKILRF